MASASKVYSWFDSKGDYWESSHENLTSVQGKPIMLIGTPEKEIEEIQKGAPDDLPEIINDLDDVGDDVALQGIMVFMTSLRVILIFLCDFCSVPYLIL